MVESVRVDNSAVHLAECDLPAYNALMGLGSHAASRAVDHERSVHGRKSSLIEGTLLRAHRAEDECVG